MLGQYEQYLDTEAIHALVAALQKPLPAAVRLNTLKIQDPAATIETYAARYGWQVKTVPFCASGWQIENYRVRPGQSPAYMMGMYYVQDAASMIPTEMFSAAETPLILDMAAAPGGKSTHLVSRFADRGYILANDSSKKRITALRSNLQVWGAFGVMTTNYPGENFGSWFPNRFDKVLLDAPCSGDTLREEKGRKQRHVSDAERESLANRQLALLSSAFATVKIGGEIVYSTCTLNPAENEGVLSSLLAHFPAEIESIEGFPQSGIKNEVFHPDVHKASRLWPHLFETSGFFAARIRKLDDSPLPAVAKDIPTHNQYPWTPLQSQIQRRIIAQLIDDYAFDFQAIIDGMALVLVQKADAIYAVPETLYTFANELPVMSLGLFIGQDKEKDFTPSHELVSRFWLQFVGQRLPLLDPTQQQIWRDGRDLRGASFEGVRMGKTALLYDEYGEFIGRGKVQQSRIRNLLPKRAI